MVPGKAMGFTLPKTRALLLGMRQALIESLRVEVNLRHCFLLIPPFACALIFLLDLILLFTFPFSLFLPIS
jgi:hypothetical protein